MLPVTHPIETPKNNVSNVITNIKKFIYSVIRVRYDDFDECHDIGYERV